MILGNTSGEVAGWGINSVSNCPSTVLMHTEMPTVTSEVCLRSYQETALRFNLTNDRTISENMFCAGSS